LELDKTPRWNPENYDDRELGQRIEDHQERFLGNRLIRHLAHCAVDYHCFAAKNLFLERWEAPLPVSRACNARCLGCLSEQPPDGCHPSHDRIAFTPRVDEVVAVAVYHLERADEPIVSFGQGCEGEPLTELDLLAESIREIRKRTSRGVINLNTNGFSPYALVRLADAGLDSVRVSLASAQEALYAAYHKPNGYEIGDVVEALREAEQRGVYTMINYLVFPGVSDQPHEMEALVSLAQETNVRFIHLKNLNIDPKFYLDSIGANDWAPGMGMEKLVDFLRFALKDTELGYFNRWSLSRHLT
jgi:MoaA/NifB/PqqE/SkfB family radical SAM enzyme